MQTNLLQSVWQGKIADPYNSLCEPGADFTNLSLFWGFNLTQSDIWLSLSLLVKLVPLNLSETQLRQTLLALSQVFVIFGLYWLLFQQPS